MDIFEGVRRIGFVIRCSCILACGAFFWTEASPVSIVYVTEGPQLPFLAASSDDCPPQSASQYAPVQHIGLGLEVTVRLCFVPQAFSGSELLVPFNIDCSGQVWGLPAYSPSVEEYTEVRATTFSLSGNEIAAARKRWFSNRWELCVMTFWVAAAIWYILFAVQLVVVWVVRGFIEKQVQKEVRYPGSANLRVAEFLGAAAAWRFCGWLIGSALILAYLVTGVAYLSYHRRRRALQGLDQWPDPHGPYYDCWSALPEGAGDYYQWLAKQKGGAEPWAS